MTHIAERPGFHSGADGVPPRTGSKDIRRRSSMLEQLALILERSGSYRVLRRLETGTTPLPEKPSPGHRIALLLDTETTGLSPDADEVIEFAAVPFTYDRTGAIVAVHDPIDQLRDPGRPIPEAVTRLTGIDDDMVRGRSIDVGAIDKLLSVTALVIAHNAGFDRAFVEKLHPRFAELPWACSMTDVPWGEEDVTTRKLEVLAMGVGVFFDAHRAETDCRAAIEILRRPLPRTGRLAMAELLRSARREGFRIAAVDAPFRHKDALKARGYRWCATSPGGPMAWTIEVDGDRREEELRFLREQICVGGTDPQVTRVDAYSRYSARI